MKELWTLRELEYLRQSLIEDGQDLHDERLNHACGEIELTSDGSLFSIEDWSNLSVDFRNAADRDMFEELEDADRVATGTTNGRSHNESGWANEFTYEIDRQRRPGTHHGRGGRPRSLTYSELQSSISSQIASKICRFLKTRCEGIEECLSEKMRESLLSIVKDDTGKTSISVPQDYNTRLHQKFKELVVREKAGFEISASPILMVCYKVPKSVHIDPQHENSMDRHCSCSWIDDMGRMHCTCIGSTQYRAIAALGIGMDSRRLCSHLKGIRIVSKALEFVFGVSEVLAAKVLSRVCLMTGDGEIETYVQSLPKAYAAHKGSVIVVATSENRKERGSVMFVPVRHITKGSVRNVCAFCDNVLHSNCHHTRTIAIIQKENGDLYSPKTSSEKAMGSQEILDMHTELSEAISHLPLSPVNCSRALSVDEKICLLTRNSKPFVLKAPLTCNSCGNKRLEISRKMWTDGIIMCTAGPCKLHVEEFVCSSDSCTARILSEGREHCIVIEKVSNAATHALMRRELYGVAVSNGTLTGRLKHFHSLVTANAYFGLIPSTPFCRSVRTLMKTCSIMLRLMCMSPPAAIFRCITCEFDGEIRKDRLTALCMDGISQGFVKAGRRNFQNVSEPCKALKSSTHLTRGRAESRMRPITRLVRETKPVTILLQAIRGQKLSCNKGNEKDFAAAVRLVSEEGLPSSFHSSTSVCGRSKGDVSNDIGYQITLHRIRTFVVSLFEEDVLWYRLLNPLRSHLGSSAIGSYIQESMEKSVLRAQTAFDPGKVCWKQCIRNSRGTHVRNDIFNLFKMIVQGPVLQFIQVSDIVSLRTLSLICCDQELNDLIHALGTPSVLLNDAEMYETNILSSLRNLRAGMLSIVELEKEERNVSIRKSTGAVLKACEELVVKFYAFYEADGRNESAFLFRDRWGTSEARFLKEKMVEEYKSVFSPHSNSQANLFAAALRTGAYFPDRPQVRPLPFNDEEINENEFENMETCSKDFLQRQNSFTPGALTFCCSCSHPKILGFKVLHRNEGPRAILDTVISRFAATPRYLIYDFCCGLFATAIHCLWWALSKTYVVCDNFHVKNHTCSTGFYPRVHTALNSTNTIAHEQRNRAITKLGNSLRNSEMELYVSLLAYQTIILNIRAQAKSSVKFHERQSQFHEFDIEWSYFHCLSLPCTCCFRGSA